MIKSGSYGQITKTIITLIKMNGFDKGHADAGGRRSADHTRLITIIMRIVIIVKE